MGPMLDDLSAETVRHLFDYDPLSGSLRWRNPPSPALVGREAGTPDAEGYRGVQINRRTYRVHRVIWLYVHGEWPTHVIDHRNERKADNGLKNLRDVTRQQNNQHRTVVSRNNTSSRSLGVSWQPSRRKWLATIQVDGKTKMLGRFASEQAASEAYLKAKAELHFTASEAPVLTSAPA